MTKNNFDESFAEAKARKEKGQRGKSAESVVQALLEKRKSEDQGFDFIRLPDSRAAGRPLPAQPCDFLVFASKGVVAVEVKQISKGARLPKKSLPQLARLHRLAKTGALTNVWVYLAESKDWFAAGGTSLSLEAKSWNVREEFLPIKLEEMF